MIASQLIQRMIQLLKENSFDSTPLLNVNIPKNWDGSISQTCLGTRLYDEEVIYRKDPRGQEYLWIGGSNVVHHLVPGSDTDTYDRRGLSITPLSLDLHEIKHVDFASDLAKLNIKVECAFEENKE